MKTTLSLVLALTALACDGLPTPDQDQPPAISDGEKIVAAFVAQAVADGFPAPKQLSEVGVLAGSWDYLTDPAIAAAIERYAMDSGTAVVCPPPEVWGSTPDGTRRPLSRSGECLGDPTWGLLEFGPFGAAPVDISSFVHWPTPDSLPARPSVYYTTTIPLEAGGWRISNDWWSIRRDHGPPSTFRYVTSAQREDR